jgi:MoxR-like ATPase
VEVVGRERELARIVAALEAGRSAVLTGPYGSGRTTLARRVAEVAAPRFRFAFVDLSAPPRQAWAALAAALAPERRRRGALAGGEGVLSLRARVLQAPAQEGTTPVVVLDDVWRLTPPRLDVVHRLALADRFRFVAILEDFLPDADRARLLGVLAPVVRVRLRPLPPSVVRRFLARAAARRRLGWSADRVRAVAAGTAGHPLAMRLALERGEVERR